MSADRDRIGLERAIEQARIGRDEGGVPIGGALIADDATILGVGRTSARNQLTDLRDAEV